MGTRTKSDGWHSTFTKGEMPRYRNFAGYVITKDGAGATPWRVEHSNGFDATFYTLAEAKFAADQNASR